MAISFTDWEGTCLAHYGILGMKWGVRRYQNKDGTLTPKGRERYDDMTNTTYKSDVHKHVKKLQKGMLSETGTDMPTFNDQSSMQDIHIKGGSVAKRLSSVSKENAEGAAYVTFNDLDHMHYASIVAEYGSSAGLYEVKGTDPEGYSLSFKVTSDMVMPSYQHRMESFVRSVGKIGIDEVKKVLTILLEKRGGLKNLAQNFYSSLVI